MIPTTMTVMLGVEPVDMRRSFDGLATLVTERFSSDPRAERMMFVFVNRHRTTLKILWRDSRGWFVLARRLDARLVALVRDIPEGARSMRIDTQTLASLLEGVESHQRESRRDVAHAAKAAAEKARIAARKAQSPT